MSDALAIGRTRAILGAILAPLVFAGLWIAPLPVSLEAHRLAAVFGAVLVLWLTEAIPIPATALLIAPALVVCEIATPRDAFRHYADPVLFLFVGGFFIAEAMSLHGLDRRVARALVTLSFVQGRASRVRVALFAAVVLLSMWISNTAATAILVPILLGLYSKRPRTDRASTGALLGLAYGGSIGGLGTLVGSPPNLITFRLLGEAGVRVGFLDWMLVGVPVTIVLAIATHALLATIFPEAAGERFDPAASFADVPARWTRGEIVTAISFSCAVTGWMVPGVVRAMGHPAADAVERFLDPGTVALGSSAILFALPGKEGERALTWGRATTIDWGIILLFGGGLALGTHLVSTGLARAMSDGFVAVTGISGLWSLTFFCCVFTIFFTEICSNTAAANMLVPLAIGIADRLDVSPIPPALAVGIAASCAFMLPIATGPNAIVYATGRVPQGLMVRTGLWLNLVGVVVVFGVLRVLCPLLGWD